MLPEGSIRGGGRRISFPGVVYAPQLPRRVTFGGLSKRGLGE
jgi:hypothetical protein